MAIDSRKSREAERFDAYRVDLMRRSVPVSKEIRQEWFERFQKLVETALPEPNKMFKKPGLATRMFAAEIEVPHSHPRDLEAMAQHLDLLWEAGKDDAIKEFRTLITPDRRDLVWEFAAEVEGAYVTGSVKLRNYSFDRESGRRDRDDRGGRPQHRGNRDRDDRGGRPPYRRDRDRDDRGGRPPYRRDRDRDDSRGRPPYRGDRDRDDRGGRPPYRDNSNRDDRGGRPPYRGDHDRDDRGGRPPYRGDRDRDDRGGRPPYRGNRDRDDRGGRPPFKGRRDGGGYKKPYGKGRPPFKKRPPKD